jgi:two-component system, OmpR family, alkaline phosphatase synthesis response regulator PhoP
MSDHRKKKVLIVDDDAAFADSNRDLLEAYGFDVSVANDGKSGLETAHKIRPDVLILDVMMTTDTEGFEVARRIPETPELRNMGVILVTGMTKLFNLPGSLHPDETWLPVDRVLEKPIPPARLIAEVERVLGERAKKRETL